MLYDLNKTEGVSVPCWGLTAARPNPILNCTSRPPAGIQPARPGDGTFGIQDDILPGQMSSETTSVIRIKGIRDGLLVTVDTSLPHRRMFSQLSQEIAGKSSFLRNSRIALEVGGRILSRDELSEIQELLAKHGLALWAILSRREATREAARDLGLATRLPGSQMDLQGNGSPTPVPAQASQAATAPANALLLKETIRSGRHIAYEGHVIVLGDVNPGAEIVADGDIVVWGKLRGLVHAGAAGDQGATVSALDLSPTQLRIADQIAVTPPADRGRRPQPETAFIRDQQIVAEPWHEWKREM